MIVNEIRHWDRWVTIKIENCDGRIQVDSIHCFVNAWHARKSMGRTIVFSFSNWAVCIRKHGRWQCVDGFSYQNWSDRETSSLRKTQVSCLNPCDVRTLSLWPKSLSTILWWTISLQTGILTSDITRSMIRNCSQSKFGDIIDLNSEHLTKRWVCDYSCKVMERTITSNRGGHFLNRIVAKITNWTNGITVWETLVVFVTLRVVFWTWMVFGTLRVIFLFHFLNLTWVTAPPCGVLGRSRIHTRTGIQKAKCSTDQDWMVRG
jgi:hypothetical protein